MEREVYDIRGRKFGVEPIKPEEAKGDMGKVAVKISPIQMEVKEMGVPTVYADKKLPYLLDALSLSLQKAAPDMNVRDDTFTEEGSFFIGRNNRMEERRYHTETRTGIVISSRDHTQDQLMDAAKVAIEAVAKEYEDPQKPIVPSVHYSPKARLSQQIRDAVRTYPTGMEGDGQEIMAKMKPLYDELADSLLKTKNEEGFFAAVPAILAKHNPEINEFMINMTIKGLLGPNISELMYTVHQADTPPSQAKG